MNNSRGNPWTRLGDGVLIAPSLLACDFWRVGEQVSAALAAGADVLHVDIMDGHFVPNLSMGPAIVKSLRKRVDAPLDVHIMVSDPAHFIDPFADAGADSITFHVEATDEPRRLIDRLHARGLGAGVSLKPRTPAAALEPIIAHVDMVLVMTVEPGYGGQKFMADQQEKIAAIRAMLQGPQRLEVDGGINPSTAQVCVRRGADVLVAGEDVFGAADIAAAVRALRAAAGEAFAHRGRR